jgi:hypothetical protein
VFDTYWTSASNGGITPGNWRFLFAINCSATAMSASLFLPSLVRAKMSAGKAKQAGRPSRAAAAMEQDLIFSRKPWEAKRKQELKAVEGRSR